jgi:peroxin-11B
MDKKTYYNLNGIKVMRLGKPIEHLQAALQATFTSGPIEETVTTIARQLSYSAYLTFDAIVWVSLAFLFILS